jgi:PST family polysaccharide transporter
MNEEIKKQLIKGGFSRIGAILFRRSIGFVRIFIFARIFNPSEIGTALLALTAGEFVSWLAGVGMPEYAIIKGKSNAAINTSFTLSVILSIITLFFFFSILPFSPRWLDARNDISLYVLLGFFLIFTVPVTFPMNLLLRDLKFDKATIPQLAADITSIIFSIIIYYFSKNGILSIIIGQAAGFIISGLVVWYLVDEKPRFEIDRALIRQVFKFAWPLSIKNFSNTLLRRTEIIILGRYYGATQNAYFNYANNLIENVNQFINQITSMIFPILARVQDDKEQFKKWYYLSAKISASIGIPAGVFFLFLLNL